MGVVCLREASHSKARKEKAVLPFFYVKNDKTASYFLVHFGFYKNERFTVDGKENVGKRAE